MILIIVAGAALFIYLFMMHSSYSNRLEQACDNDLDYKKLIISYPFNRTIFPPEIIPPVFKWQDQQSTSDKWAILFELADIPGHLTFFSDTTTWRPDTHVWEKLKKHSIDNEAHIVIAGFNRSRPQDILSKAELSIMISKDIVGAPIFYRSVNLPFVEAVKDPSLIQWRLGYISSPEQPAVVLHHLPVCGNCHSFSADAKYLAMDVDYANDKGSYIITKVAEQMRLATSEIITWDDFASEKSENQPLFHRDITTFGLLSQISPDGQFVISTVKDQSVFVAKPDLYFSQLFFPVKGILAIYERQHNNFTALAGADDPDFVQSNASWSPDGQHIVFARSRTYQFQRKSVRGKVLLTQEECEEFVRDGKPFLFDLYTIPFNRGKGGAAEPLKGASINGMSNFFAKYSPDGKWIVFCKAMSYMLLQPDSKLYIIPAQGGEARELSGNTPLMNSWHSWSPNSKWLVFSSKANSPYTQLFLTHIDECGNSSPPILLEQFSQKNRAANIPEFMNSLTRIEKIDQQFIDDYSYVRKGELSVLYGDYDDAIDSFHKALELNSENYWAHMGLGLLFHDKGQVDSALIHYKEAYNIEPRNAVINYELGLLLYKQNQFKESIFYLSEALRYGQDEAVTENFDPAVAGYYLGCALIEDGRLEEANKQLLTIVAQRPDNAEYQYMLAVSFALSSKVEQMYQHYHRALSLKPAIDKSPIIHACIAKHHAQNGEFKKAIGAAERALKLAAVSGNKSLATTIQNDLYYYQQRYSEKRSETN